MAGINALRSSKTLDEVKKLVMKDLAVQQQLLDVVSVPLQRQIMEQLQKQKLNDCRLHELSISEKKLESWSLLFDELKESWSLLFDKLKAYKQSHEHCNVSPDSPRMSSVCEISLFCFGR